MRRIPSGRRGHPAAAACWHGLRRPVARGRTVLNRSRGRRRRWSLSETSRGSHWTAPCSGGWASGWPPWPAPMSRPNWSSRRRSIPDPGATTMVRAGVGGRLTALEAREWPRVGERLEAGEQIAQVGDARPIAVPRGGTVARLLSQPGELVQPGQVLLELVDFSAALIRVAWPGAGTPPTRMQFGLTREGARFSAAYQGAAPEADPLTRGPALLYRAAAPGRISGPVWPCSAFARIRSPAARRGAAVGGSGAMGCARLGLRRTGAGQIHPGARASPTMRSSAAGWSARASHPAIGS